ncbi:MAG: hypothetical protein A2826_00715 [Candidatus Doudnabacteria bacterium RIFCSPHIGHO2_01_FULL_43_23]|uniref:DUF5673 domain-containing protein n=1 Tax=Candidatus Doudnabacteria bacterium RIFCSPHIGHO2_01_FULL_43_23 TaxID=1817822 RepID=A0A1F5NUP7_9BACT|nr:MAG: hypothetical protein A2826_00715 [Candidatus Doudnabacteria bacterium RIFCSPHIGHO2_01_FULL_43_23]
MQKNQDQISWEASEFAHYEKSGRWYIILLVVGILILAYALWREDYLMFATLLILLVATYIFAKKKPKQIQVKLSSKGISLNESEYPYSMIKTFWIHYNPPEIKTLNFETSQLLNKEIVVQIEDANPNEIREFLTEYIPEDFEREESYPDKLLRRIKF